MAATQDLTLEVNGEPHDLSVAPRRLLADVLRTELGLTGTKRGCDTAECGACTVLLDGDPVKACNLLALQADGAAVTTVEGLAMDGELTALQQAFWDEYGFQCGFCTPGFLMAGTALLADNDDPSEAEIREALAGNLCRCTGYVKIVDAVKAAADAPSAGGE